eukprot:scaffold77889_cov17-Tisochrysis_lutea.AAC.1
MEHQAWRRAGDSRHIAYSFWHPKQRHTPGCGLGRELHAAAHVQAAACVRFPAPPGAWLPDRIYGAWDVLPATCTRSNHTHGLLILRSSAPYLRKKISDAWVAFKDCDDPGFTTWKQKTPSSLEQGWQAPYQMDRLTTQPCWRMFMRHILLHFCAPPSVVANLNRGAKTARQCAR